MMQLPHSPAPASAGECCNGHPIQVVEPVLEKVEDGELLDRPRIAFGFNRRDYGRLRELIEVLNGL